MDVDVSAGDHQPEDQSCVHSSQYQHCVCPAFACTKVAIAYQDFPPQSAKKVTKIDGENPVLTENDSARSPKGRDRDYRFQLHIVARQRYTVEYAPKQA